MEQEKNEKDKQTLIDIVFETVMIVAKHKSFRKMSNQELAEWTAKQLKDCGFPTIPCGSSWGVLTTLEKK